MLWERPSSIAIDDLGLSDDDSAEVRLSSMPMGDLDRRVGSAERRNSTAPTDDLEPGEADSAELRTDLSWTISRDDEAS
jgi:hypothetical protein